MWRDEEVRDVEMKLENDKLTGTVHLETKDGKRGYEAELLGEVETKDARLPASTSSPTATSGAKELTPAARQKVNSRSPFPSP